MSFVIQILISIIAGFDVYIVTLSHVFSCVYLMSVPVFESSDLFQFVQLCACIDNTSGAGSHMHV